MKILFYDAKPYDIESFDKLIKNYDGISIDYLKTDISKNTVRLAEGYEAVCVFVASDVNAEIIDELSKRGVKLILLRCAGFNNVDIQRAKEKGITVLLIEQNANMALKAADQAYVMETGRITMSGTGTELLENDDIKAAYLGKSKK